MIQRIVNNKVVVAGDNTPTPGLDIIPFNPQKFMRFVATLSAADLADPTLTMNNKLEGFFPDGQGGGQWVEQTSSPWRGGGLDRQGNPIPPSLYYEPSAGLWPTQLRCYPGVSRDTRMSVDLEVQ